MWAVARKAKQKPQEEQLVCTRLVRSVAPYLRALDGAGHRVHGNVQLHITDALVVLLCAFFNPTVRSLRLVEQLSQMNWVKGQLNVERVCRSTLSDAFERFDPQHLVPLIRRLMEQMPQLKRVDADLEGLCRRVIAADGSVFSLASDVAWALMQPKGNGKSHGTCRLNLQLCIDSFVPADLSVSGADEGSEPAAFLERIISGVIYLMDRNFVHFALINRILEKDSDFVLRLKKVPNFQARRQLPLTAKDLEAGVVSDRVGVLPGPLTAGNKGRSSRTGQPPGALLREVVVVDGGTGQQVRLLTSLLDVAGHVIGSLYRHRWQIELFLRWLKVWAGMEHLMSHSQKGITFQFYVAVIACLLMHIRTGRKVNKYALFLFGQVAAGQATLEQILPMLERIEREKELERIRLAKKKGQKLLSGGPAKTSCMLPG